MMNITRIEDRHTSGAYPKRPLAIVRGEGCTVWDDAGNAYIDATSGQGVALLGHAHPAVVEAVERQARRLITCPEIFYNDRRAELYTLLADVTGCDRFFLCNSGAEAIEGALKATQIFTRRSGIIATKRAFHGRTRGALALTWNPKYRKQFSAWLGEGVTHVTYNDLDAMAEAITEETAAIVLEPVQGEGGVYPAKPGYLEGVRALCDEHGALLVVDEIQTGFGRTGKWFAFQHSNVMPDIIALGKGIAGGLPMGAACWRKSLGQLPGGSHGSTFGGNPLACAAAIAAISTIRDEDLPSRAAEHGRWLLDALRALDNRAIREVRGLGLMVGVDLRGRATPVLKALQTRGVLALPAGFNVLRLLPPLVIDRATLTRVVNAIEASLIEQ
jgi:acetylornithine/LysW-gamma-L-lysine aminotransferase